VSEALVQDAPDDVAWRLRAQVLSRVHRFVDARAALANVADKGTIEDIEVTLAQSTGDLDRALLYRHKLANEAPNPQTITMYAATLAELGKFDDALALLTRATTKVRVNTPDFINWLLFQWGRVYELKGDVSIARDFYLEAYRRLPGSLETVEHLVATLIATGDTARAKEILAPAVAENPHPTLRALAVKLGIAKESAADVAAEWERYVTALPEAFSDHAARFYLDVGANPKRALELARLNFANRPTFDARALVVDAALASDDPTAACADVDLLIKAHTHAAKFTAWKALSACGRTDDAQRLAHELGI
jgi:tetratricopeptide (TPR) repeat protein